MSNFNKCIHNWINNKNINEEYNRKHKYNLKLITKYISNFINKNKYFTIDKLKLLVSNYFKLNISRTLVYSIITKKLKFSFKKTHNKFLPANAESLKDKINSYLQKLKTITRKNVISIDETYFKTKEVPNYGWCRQGSKLTVYKKVQIKKYSVIMAISNKKIIHYLISDKNINSNSFCKFMNDVCSKTRRKYFLMDNVSFHKSKVLMELIKNKKRKIIYTPPYSPQYNPIEEVFSEIKRKYRYLNVSSQLYKSNIRKAIYSINKSNLIKYYSHAKLI